MNDSELVKPKYAPHTIFKSYIGIISVLITSVAFVLSGQELSSLSAFLTILLIIILAFIIYNIIYLISYMIYLYRVKGSYSRLLQLYGDKKMEADEKGEVINSHRNQLLDAFRLGTMRGVNAKANELITDLVDKDIHIRGKRASDNGDHIELIFEVGSNSGIGEGTLLSISTPYGDLWGVIIVDNVSENECKGRVFSRINTNFWGKLEEDMFHDPSPPVGVTARLYLEDHLMKELEWMEDKINGS